MEGKKPSRDERHLRSRFRSKNKQTKTAASQQSKRNPEQNNASDTYLTSRRDYLGSLVASPVLSAIGSVTGLSLNAISGNSSDPRPATNSENHPTVADFMLSSDDIPDKYELIHFGEADGVDGEPIEQYSTWGEFDWTESDSVETTTAQRQFMFTEDRSNGMGKRVSLRSSVSVLSSIHGELITPPGRRGDDTDRRWLSDRKAMGSTDPSAPLVTDYAYRETEDYLREEFKYLDPRHERYEDMVPVPTGSLEELVGPPDEYTPGDKVYNQRAYLVDTLDWGIHELVFRGHCLNRRWEALEMLRTWMDELGRSTDRPPSISPLDSAEPVPPELRESAEVPDG